jgi:hypothetical protein
MELTELARVGDTIKAEVKSPRPGVMCVKLRTPEACAYGNGLLVDKASGWRLVRQPTQGEP